MKYTFPAILFPDDDCIGVRFYDIDNCFTFGRNFLEAIDNAEDALNLMLWHLEDEDRTDEIPAPTPIGEIKLNKHESVMMIDADTESYAALMATMNFDDENFDEENLNDDDEIISKKA